MSQSLGTEQIKMDRNAIVTGYFKLAASGKFKDALQFFTQIVKHIRVFTPGKGGLRQVRIFRF